MDFDDPGQPVDWPDFQSERRLELAKETYQEVLDATKHQDDKVGRYLAAIAFLTTGAIAFLFGGSDLKRQFSFAGDFPLTINVPLVALAAGGFFACVLLSVGLLLLCLSTPLRAPSQRRDRPSSLVSSRIFFNYIGGEPVRRWERRWTERPSAITRELSRQYVRESHNLAERVRAKYQHTGEAAILFVFSLLFLALAIAFTIWARFEPPRSEVVVDRGISLTVALVAVLYSWAILRTQVVDEIQSVQTFLDAETGARYTTAKGIESHEEAKRKRKATRRLTITAWLVPVALTAIALTGDDPSARWCLGLASSLLLGFSLWVTSPRWYPAAQACRACAARIAIVSVLGFGAIVTCFALWGPLQLVLLLAYPSYLSFEVITQGSRRDRATRYGLVASMPWGHSVECMVYPQRASPDLSAADDDVGVA
jgi:hypothetical protein